MTFVLYGIFVVIELILHTDPHPPGQGRGTGRGNG